MTRTLRFVLLAGCLAAMPSLVRGQSCQIYTYSDVWLDGNGNVVASNYTDGDSSCGNYSAYADVTITMPSGYSQYASATASCCTEAIASASILQEAGDGSVVGTNEVDFAFCGSATASLSSGISIKKTTWGPPPIVTNDQCIYVTLACAFGTPTCKSATPGITFVPSCPSYMLAQYLVVNGTCEFALGTAATGPGECN